MARKKDGTLSQIWGSFNILTKLFLLTAVVSIMVVTIFIQNPQSFQQEAARGGNSRYTINLLTTNPIFAGSAYFNVSGKYIASGGMWLLNTCSQDKALVYQQYLKIAIDGNSGPFTLGPTPSWTSGGADCTVAVGLFQHGSFRPQASISYTVAP
jgi:hypothetical protein